MPSFRSQFLYLSHSHYLDQLLWLFFATLFRFFSAISEAEKTEPSIIGQEIIDTFVLSSWRGQKSAEF